MLLKIVILSGIHKNDERLFFQFAFNDTINNIIRKIPGARWSQSKKMWHCPATDNVLQSLKEQTKGIAIISMREHKKKLIVDNLSAVKKNNRPIAKIKSNRVILPISEQNNAEVQRLVEQL